MRSLISHFKINKRKLKELDKVMIVTMICIVLIGIANIYLATKGKYQTTFYPTRQFMYLMMALVAVVFIIAVDYNLIKVFTPFIYWGSIGLLILTMFIGDTINGAKAWIDLGIMSFQPSELAKLGTIMMMGIKLEKMEGEINNFKNICILGIYALIPAVFLIIQPDMGMTMVLFFMVVGVFFIAGLDRRVILGGLGTLVVGIVIVWNSGLIQDYQKQRFTSFLNPELDTSASGYHLQQSLIGVGAGGFFGEGNSFEMNGTGGYVSQYVPEIQTDFIFTQLAEQWGTIGAMALLLLYGILISRMINIARNSVDIFGEIVTTGMISYFLFAIWQNIGMTIGLMPITGITLPLVSYGGSSLLMTIISLGLVLRTGIRKQRITF